MTELIFIEGVSGVGKSTMVRTLSEELKNRGYMVETYVEFDYRNPIDFYCTAYLSLEEYEMLCSKYQEQLEQIRKNTIAARNVRLIRYYDDDTPLFEEPLLSDLMKKEFCYNPVDLVLLNEYTNVYKEVWANFSSALDERFDFIIFDGSLLHHPINDMMRNYNITGEQAVVHIKQLLNSLGKCSRHIYYLKTENIGEQLKRAHVDRGQKVPTKGQIEFWETRFKNDMYVLSNIQSEYQIFDVSNEGWDIAKEKILKDLLKMYHSYVMGVDNSILELKQQGFTVENDGDNYMVSFSADKALVWEEYITKHLELGYWNEYLTEDKVIFLFHLEDGIKKYEVYNFSNDEVLALCEKLCECKFTSIRDMLIGNHFYNKIIGK